MKRSCVADTWFRKGEKRKLTYSPWGNESEIDFVLVGKGNRKYLRDVEVIPGELQHRSVVVDLVKKKVVRKKATERGKVWKLKEVDTRARFKERVRELVSADAPDFWKFFREVCGKTKGSRDIGDKWWWNKDVKEAIARKKDVHKEMCKSRTEANKARYKNMKNRAKNVVIKAMKDAAEQELSEHPNKVFKLVKSMKKDGKDVEGGRCVRGSDRRLNFSEKDRGRVWKDSIPVKLVTLSASNSRIIGHFTYMCRCALKNTYIHNFTLFGNAG